MNELQGEVQSAMERSLIDAISSNKKRLLDVIGNGDASGKERSSMARGASAPIFKVTLPISEPAEGPFSGPFSGPLFNNARSPSETLAIPAPASAKRITTAHAAAAAPSAKKIHGAAAPSAPVVDDDDDDDDDPDYGAGHGAGHGDIQKVFYDDDAIMVIRKGFAIPCPITDIPRNELRRSKPWKNFIRRKDAMYLVKHSPQLFDHLQGLGLPK